MENYVKARYGEDKFIGVADLILDFFVVFLTLCLKKIDVSVAYAVWAGLGTALIAIIGILWFKEPLGALKVISLVLIVGGVVGLNLSGVAH